VIDLSQMRTVTVDPTSAQLTFKLEQRSVIVETTTQYGLVTATACSAVGMAGFTLGGGYSEHGAYGLGIDNLLSAQVVTADGQLLTPKNIPICFGDYAVGEATLALSSRWSIACIHSRPCYLGCCSIR